VPNVRRVSGGGVKSSSRLPQISVSVTLRSSQLRVGIVTVTVPSLPLSGLFSRLDDGPRRFFEQRHAAVESNTKTKALPATAKPMTRASGRVPEASGSAASLAATEASSLGRPPASSETPASSGISASASTISAVMPSTSMVPDITSASSACTILLTTTARTSALASITFAWKALAVTRWGGVMVTVTFTEPCETVTTTRSRGTSTDPVMPCTTASTKFCMAIRFACNAL